MAEQDDEAREFDIKWADGAELKEPSARARMLAARWKENPPEPQPFRAEAEFRARRRSALRTPRRSAWGSAAIVFGCVAAVILLLGYTNFRGSY
ncbi:SCO2583/SCO2584 N-terminal domain-containing protein [Streptomyces griseorubiginosus]|uniref:SCO2583/SCO2584 N-terminal domain-containing protein n=1 Tax=Streptomyces griseorubiginosus TaxID=67304 RepID=UPI0036E50AB3